MWNIVDHIKSSIYYFESMYGKSPETIFISTPLMYELEHELTLVHCHRYGNYTTCCGILVKEFPSDECEYYLAERGHRISF